MHVSKIDQKSGSIHHDEYGGNSEDDLVYVGKWRGGKGKYNRTPSAKPHNRQRYTFGSVPYNSFYHARNVVSLKNIKTPMTLSYGGTPHSKPIIKLRISLLINNESIDIITKP